MCNLAADEEWQDRTDAASGHFLLITDYEFSDQYQ